MRRYILTLFFLLLVFAVGCGKQEKSKEDTTEEAVATATEPTLVHEEVEKTSVLVGVDLDKKEMFFRDIVTGEDRRLEYHGGVSILNKYSDELLLDNLVLGGVYDVTYYGDTQRLLKIAENSAAVSYKEIEKFSADKETNTAMYKGTICKMSRHIAVFDEAKLIDVSEINLEDELTITYYGDKLVSAVIDKGHGYVRLVNHATYIGGMVEIGYDVVVPVTQDMLVPVREGMYTLRINRGIYRENKKVNVIRDRESTVDIGDIAIPSGVVNFIVTPKEAEASLYVNDLYYEGLAFTAVYDTNYSFVIKAEGYKDYKGSVNIKEPLRDYEIKLTPDKSGSGDENSSEATTSTGTGGSTTGTGGSTTGTGESTTGTGGSTTGTGESTTGTGGSTTGTGESTTGTGESTTGTGGSTSGTDSTTGGSTMGEATSEVSGDTSSANSGTTTQAATTEQITNNKVTVKEPTSVGVYFDGDFVGTSPVSFPKVVGTHTITLYQKGYLIKSYTIVASDDGKDIECKYSPLVSLSDAINKSNRK